MRFSCCQKAILNKINIVYKAINNKTTLDALKGILIEAKNDIVTLTAYNMELGIRSEFQANVIEEGVILIDAKLFSDIVRKLPNDMIDFISKDEILDIKCNRSNYSIKLGNPSDYVSLPTIEQEQEVFEIYKSELKQMIKETSYAISQDTTKPVLMGALLELTNDSVSFTALDGYKFAMSKVEFDVEDEGEERFSIKLVVPGKTLSDLNSILDNNDDIVELGFDDKHAIFKFNDETLITRLIGGDFIDCAALMPNSHTTKVKVDRKELLDCVDRAALVASQEKNSLIKLVIDDEFINIECSSNVGRVHEQIKAEQEGDYIEISFNARYLGEALRVVDEEIIYLEFTSSTYPMYAYCNNNTNYKCVVMPVRTR